MLLRDVRYWGELCVYPVLYPVRNIVLTLESIDG